MICQAHDEQIGDYVDGTLPFTERARLEAHFAGCARCRAVAADFRAIRSIARSLEPQVPPPHVWRQLSTAARTSGGWPSLRAFFFAWQPAAATAMAMALSVGLWWIGHQLAAVAPTSSGRADLTASADPALAGSEERRQGVPGDSAPLAAEVHYTSAIASLEEFTGTERGVLDPDMIDVLDTGMTIIDAAIDQSRAALETNPDSEVAQESLFQALRTKVALLQDTLSLVNEMRKESSSGPEERRQGVPGSPEERRQGVPGSTEERRQGVPVDSPRTNSEMTP